MKMVKIQGCIKDYEWGSRDILPSLFGYRSDGRPQAEAWFGVHPQGPSRTEDGKLLIDHLKEDPEENLGSSWMSAIEHFPFMLKVLAVNSPLSLHVHPNSAQALSLWQDEEILRKLGRSGEVDISDKCGKNELFYALRPSTILCGFREAEDARYHMKRLLPRSYEAVFGSAQTSRGLLKALYSLSGDELKRVVDEYLASLEEADEALSRSAVYPTERAISEKIFSLFSYEPAILVSYLMNLVHLRIGEAILIESGSLHTYVSGYGIEIEDSSDNEKRLGITTKHADVAGALSLVDSREGHAGKMPITTDSFLRQRAQGPGWSLAIMHSGSYDIHEKVPGLLLCTEGLVRVGTSFGHLMLRQGECAFIPSCDDEYHVRVSGMAVQALFGED